MNKKLMVVAPYFYPKIGGMENYAWNISKGLKEKFGWEVVVVTSNHVENKYKEETLKGIKIYKLPAWFKISNTPINPMWYFQIRKIIQIEKPDIINAHTPVPFMSDICAFASRNTKFIVTYHAGSMLKGNILTDIPLFIYEKFIMQYMLKKADILIAVSEFVKNGILKNYKYKTEVITPGVDTSIFKPGLNKKKNNTVLYVGRIDKSSEWKGIRFLIGAVKELKYSNLKINLKLIGSGDAVDYYKKYTKSVGIDNIEFTGPLRGNKLLNEYQNADILVLPSTSDAESFGMVIIEAMACRLPVIGTKVGGVMHLIKHMNDGIIVDRKNSNAIKNAIELLLVDKKRAKRIADCGLRKVLSIYDIQYMINKTYKLFYD